MHQSLSRHTKCGKIIFKEALLFQCMDLHSISNYVETLLFEANLERAYSFRVQSGKITVCNYFGSFVRNHVKLLHVYKSRRGFSKGTVLCGGSSYGLGRSHGHCRPALPKGRKYQMVKTQTQSHDRRPVV